MYTDCHVNIVLKADGNIDLSALLSKSQGQDRHRVAFCWIKELKERLSSTARFGFAKSGVLPLMVLLEALASMTKGLVFVCCHVGGWCWLLLFGCDVDVVVLLMLLIAEVVVVVAMLWCCCC